MATVTAVTKEQENIDITLTCSFASQLRIDQSVAHNGVCLTVVAIEGDTYTVTAMKETLERSNLGALSVGDRVNVERSMLMNGRLDGHIVQGHVDQTAVCTDMSDAGGSTYFTFRYPYDRDMARRGYFTVDKGSVTVNGVSLTVCNPTEDSFQVATDHTLHTGQYQLCRHTGRLYGQHRVRHTRQVYRQIAVVSVNDCNLLLINLSQIKLHSPLSII